MDTGTWAGDSGLGSPMADCGLSPQLTGLGLVGCGAGQEREERGTTDTLRHYQPGERHSGDTPSQTQRYCEM